MASAGAPSANGHIGFDEIIRCPKLSSSYAVRLGDLSHIYKTPCKECRFAPVDLRRRVDPDGAAEALERLFGFAGTKRSVD